MNQEVQIGSVQVFLQPIAYMVMTTIEKIIEVLNLNALFFSVAQVEMKEQLEINDLKGNKIGVMNVSPDEKQ